MKFKDSQGREYDCIVSAATAIRFKKEYAINLADHFTGDLWRRFADDPELLVNCIADACRIPLDAQQDFASALDGNAFDAAVTALRDAITDFSPPRQRAAFKNLMVKTDQAVSLGLEKVERTINKMTPESILTSFNSSGNNPGSSDSNQANSTDSDSGNSAGSSGESDVKNGTDMAN